MSIFGGAKFFKMNERLEKEFMRGIVEVAKIAGKIWFCLNCDEIQGRKNHSIQQQYYNRRS